MSLNYNAIKKSFNKVAAHYHKNAVLQKEVLSRLLERLDDEHRIDTNLKPQSILDLGCGIGWAYEGFKTIFPKAKITGLDFSEQMLNQIKYESMSKVCSDAHDLPFSDNSFDIVFSNMLLHWSNESDVFNECLRVLKPNGLLIMSCLGETSLYELKDAFKTVDNYPHVHSFPALHELGDEMLKKGFQQVVVNAEVLTLTYENIIKLMKDIKASGGHNVEEKRIKSLKTRQYLKNLSQAYEVYREDNRLPASYEIVYLRGLKPKLKGDIGLTIQN